jgi:hypothetical protein
VAERGQGRRLRLAVAAVTAALALAATGCAAVPTSGLLQSTPMPPGVGGGQGGGGCCRVVWNGPQAGWLPQDIVSNFLQAGADFANHRAVAREYLTTAASAGWQPGPGPAVMVIAGPPATSLARQFGSPPIAEVKISVQVLGQVTASGQYIPEPGGQADLQQTFGLQRVAGQWRIAQLPPDGNSRVSHELMLPKDLFQQAYQPEDLYYLDPSGRHLVPDPVFVPVGTTSLASDLVNALRATPQGWLADGVLSAFPPAARLLRPVEVPPGSKTAIVSLGLPDAAATPSSLAQMSAQLVWTLTNPVFRSSSITAVKLYVNGRPWTPPGAGSAVQSRSDYPQPGLHPAPGQNLYFLTADGAARMLPGPGPRSIAVPGPAGTGHTPFSSIAVSPDQRYLAGVAGVPGGSTVYTEDVVAAARHSASAGGLKAQLSGITVTALSWDTGDNLWVAGSQRGQSRIWVLSPAGGPRVAVPLPSRVRQVSALRVAPDGVRVAMIAGTASGPQLLLAAIVRNTTSVRADAQVTFSTTTQVGADLRAPTALSWYDADHLLVVNDSAAGPALEQVPVDGDRSSYQGVEPEMTTITAAGPRNDVFAGLQSGYLARTVGLNELWSQYVPGRAPVFPG